MNCSPHICTPQSRCTCTHLKRLTDSGHKSQDEMSWGTVSGNNETLLVQNNKTLVITGTGNARLPWSPPFPRVSQDANPTAAGRRKHLPASSPLCLLSPFLHLFSSDSRCWMTLFKALFFSFSFSYFFFHSSAVSSKFTETVFLMVFALGLKHRK